MLGFITNSYTAKFSYYLYQKNCTMVVGKQTQIITKRRLHSQLVVQVQNLLINELKSEEEAIRVLDDVRDGIKKYFADKNSKPAPTLVKIVPDTTPKDLNNIEKQSRTLSIDTSLTYRLFFDGASKNNPGPAAAGALIKPLDNETFVWKGGKSLEGDRTCNYAEYSALILGLKKAAEMKIQHLKVFGDSQLVINQMKGTFKVSSPNILPLYIEAKGLSKKFVTFGVEHVRREKNTEADLIANEALLRGSFDIVDGKIIDNSEDLDTGEDRSTPQRIRPRYN